MFQGEVNVAENNLGSFLDASKDLQIRGLSENVTEDFNIKVREEKLRKYSHKQTTTSSERNGEDGNVIKNAKETHLKGPLKNNFYFFNDSVDNRRYTNPTFASTKEEKIEEEEENYQSLVLASEKKHLICKNCH